MPHKFKIGESIRLAFGFYDHGGDGLFAIVSQLPTQENGQPHYVVRGADDRQRVIGEGQIRSATKQTDWSRRSSNNPITRLLDDIKADLGMRQAAR